MLPPPRDGISATAFAGESRSGTSDDAAELQRWRAGVMRRLVGSFGVAAIAAILCLLVAEWVVARSGILEYPPAMNRGHATRGYALRPGFVGTTAYGIPLRINALGLRGPEVAVPKPAGTKRVLVLGDSVTFGAGVAEEATFPRKLESALREDLACPLDVVNAGVSGYGTIEELDYLEHDGLALDPDVVLVYHIENDSMVVPHLQGNWARFAKDQVVYRSYLIGAVLYAVRTARWKLEAACAGGDRAAFVAQQRAWDERPGAAESLAALRRIVEVSRAAGASVVVASQPSNQEDHSVDAVRNRLLAAVAAESGAQFADLGPALDERGGRSLAVSERDLHPNGFAHGLIAEGLRPVVRDALHCAPRANARS